ncbi:MAG: EF-P 5-aminopentanol modification-associated protein YfmF [Tepidanaerobacteraceae bacterium]
MKDIFIHRVLQNGVNLYVYPTRKFKTLTFCLFMHQSLKKDTATKTALLPFVLRRGTKSFPTTRLLNLHLEGLYGADLGADVIKRGESHILQFFIETIGPKYKDGEGILDEALNVFREFILDPVTEGNRFKKDYVEQEKDVLKRNIESLYSDKFNYAIERCFQEMCKEEDFSIYRYGNIEDLPKIDNQNLYYYYLDCLKKCPLNIFVLGDIEAEEVAEKMGQLFDYQRGGPKVIKTSAGPDKIDKPKIVEEKIDISQGKLSMGYRTNIRYGDEDYYALMVYNGILGGGTHSKLFQNVREKESLAYYAFSKLEKTKGLMLVSCGIDFNNYEKAVEIIQKQFEDIKKGKISDYEFDSTVKNITNTLKEAGDSPSKIISLYLDGIINGIYESSDEMISKIQKVKKDDIVNIAEKIWLDTVFFLNRK